MNNKICEVCGQEKPAEAFSKSYKNRCRDCVAEQARQKRQNKDTGKGQPDGDDTPGTVLETQPDWELRRYALALSLFRESISIGGWLSAKEAAADAVETATTFINAIKNSPL